jgi:hypothetical protein
LRAGWKNAASKERNELRRLHGKQFRSRGRRARAGGVLPAGLIF